MYRTAAIVLGTLVAMGLAGCGSSAPTPSSTGAPLTPSSSASSSPTSATPLSPTVNAPLSAAPAGRITHRMLVQLAGDITKNHLVVVAHTASGATLTVYRWHHQSWIAQWSKSWNISPTPENGRFQLIGAVPLMGGPTEQLVTTFWSTGGDAGSSQAQVWRWNGHALTPVLTLDEPDGAVSVSIHGHALNVSGFYLEPGHDCMACADHGHTTVTYRDGHWSGTGGGYYNELTNQNPPSNPSPSPAPRLSPSVQTNTAVGS